MSQATILLIDDERHLLETIKEFLQEHGMQVVTGGSCADAERLWRSARPDLAVLDYMLPDGNAIQLIQEFREYDPTFPIVVLTGHGTIERAVEAIKAGAENLLPKPANPSALLGVIQRALENTRNRRNRLVDDSKKKRIAFDPFVGVSREVQQLKDIAHKVAATDSFVLIDGETGTGKGVLAHWIHNHSLRAQSSYVDLNCAGLPRDLLESEMFGHDKGAFTGAVQAKIGLFDAAHKGTLFLDEIGDIDLAVQGKLLKVLEEKRFRRLGDVKDRVVDIRLIAATHRDLVALVRKGSFRDDFYFRISTFPITIPPLRHRRADIPYLVRSLLGHLTLDTGRNVEVTKSAMAKLSDYSWPGNIRELRNVLERAILLGDSRVLDENYLRFDPLFVPNASNEASGGTLEALEREHIQSALSLENGRVEAAARRLGIPRSSLYLKLKQYNIERHVPARM